MNEYGMVVKNSNGDIMFDSRKFMGSLVVVAEGNASSFTDYQSGDWVFVKGGNAPDNVIYSNISGSTISFGEFDLSADSDLGAVFVDYFVLRESANISVPAGEDYGLMIRNPDGSVQFDSRTVKTNYHYAVTGYNPPRDVLGNGVAVGLPGEYCRIDNWSQGLNLGTAPNLAGVEFDSSGFNIHKFTTLVGPGAGARVERYVPKALFYAVRI